MLRRLFVSFAAFCVKIPIRTVRSIRIEQIGIIDVVHELFREISGIKWFDDGVAAVAPAQQIHVTASFAAERKEFRFAR